LTHEAPGFYPVGRQLRADNVATIWSAFRRISVRGPNGRFLLFFFVESWLKHLRQPKRVTEADRRHEDDVRQFQINVAPKVTYVIAASAHTVRHKKPRLMLSVRLCLSVLRAVQSAGETHSTAAY
jgi:hypothetical protein